MPKASSSKTVAIVLARGGSKGIPRKNMMEFCGHPLLWWTLDRILRCPEIDEVWVSSDDVEIQQFALDHGSNVVVRPPELATDEATSESSWLHALSCTKDQPGIIVAPQVTSPIRDSSDFQLAIRHFKMGGFDSLFSASPAKDLCLWDRCQEGGLICQSYNPKNPDRRRQTTFKRERLIENGSFYLFKPEVLINTGLRFGNKLTIHHMPIWKGFEIDEPQDVPFLEVLMKAHLEGIL